MIDPPPLNWSTREACLYADRRTTTPSKLHEPEEVVTKLRQANVLTEEGQQSASANLERQLVADKRAEYRIMIKGLPPHAHRANQAMALIQSVMECERTHRPEPFARFARQAKSLKVCDIA